MASREIRDPIHGFIKISGTECDIVDSAVFQRLRKVRQLAMAYLVYPGAVHSRFEHTLGVRHVAGKMCERLSVDPEHTDTIQKAALLHDIGHGPFSHVSEQVLEELGTEELKTTAGEKDKIHEVVTRKIIRTDREIGDLISAKQREDIINLLDDGLDQPLYKGIVSGPIDADKQDYLLRDSYYCGVQYGHYDIDRLHAVLARHTDSAGGDIICIEQDGLNTIEQFVLARYFETTQIIRHRIRQITDAMLLRALSLGVRVDNLQFLRDLYTFSDSEAFARNYLSWNDERLVSRLLEPEHEGTRAGRIFRLLANRRLFKQTLRVRLSDIGADAAMNPKKVKEVRQTIEAEVAERLSSLQGTQVEPEMVIVEVSKQPPARKDEGSLLVKDGTRLVPLESQSVIFGSISEKLSEQHLQCYAPLAIADEGRRRTAEDEIRQMVVSRVNQLISAQKPLPLDAQAQGEA